VSNSGATMGMHPSNQRRKVTIEKTDDSEVHFSRKHHRNQGNPRLANEQEKRDKLDQIYGVQTNHQQGKRKGQNKRRTKPIYQQQSTFAKPICHANA